MLSSFTYTDLFLSLSVLLIPTLSYSISLDKNLASPRMPLAVAQSGLVLKQTYVEIKNLCNNTEAVVTDFRPQLWWVSRRVF